MILLNYPGLWLFILIWQRSQCFIYNVQHFSLYLVGKIENKPRNWNYSFLQSNVKHSFPFFFVYWNIWEHSQRKLRYAIFCLLFSKSIWNVIILSKYKGHYSQCYIIATDIWLLISLSSKPLFIFHCRIRILNK